MATGFILNKVDFGNTPAGVQTFAFFYKLWSQPDSSYITITGSVGVNPDGSINASPPLDVTGLTPGQLYYVKAENLCNSPIDYFIKPIQL
jgi:hypothetical protein